MAYYHDLYSSPLSIIFFINHIFVCVEGSFYVSCTLDTCLDVIGQRLV